LAVHIIIDGYNLIRQSPELSRLDQRDIQAGREALIDRLVAYKRIKPHQITVVFDGTRAPAFSLTRDRVRGILVVFSRSGETADAVIKRIAAREREKALVVSSDRAVTHAASASGAAVIESPEFEDKITMAAYVDAKGDSDDSSREWIPTTRKKGPSRRLSKKKRRSQAKIRKL